MKRSQTPAAYHIITDDNYHEEDDEDDEYDYDDYKIIAMILFVELFLRTFSNGLVKRPTLISFPSHHAYLAICESYFGLSFES